MTPKDETAAKDEIVYSETFEINDPELKNKRLADAIGKLEAENKEIYLALQHLEEERGLLKDMFAKANNELENLKKPSLLVAEIVSLIDNDKAIIKLPNGNKFYCHISKEVEPLQNEDSVLVEQKSLNVVKKVNLGNNFDVEKFVIVEKPQESWHDLGGLGEEIREIKEVIELPLKKPELFEKVGINPPKGVLLYGPPGTGKTLLAKAVANSTKATFIEVVGSELVQKFIGEGAKLVKEIFQMAIKKAPTIVFIDEIDALAAHRMETGTSGEREVNRTFMQLLAELDGFEHLGNVKVIGATNRLDILDNAVIRPGRLDRLIEIGLPDEQGIQEIFKVHTRRMSLQKVKVKELIKEMENFSGAEVQAVCTEAGYFAIRENREYVTQDDFLGAIEKVRMEDEEREEQFFG